MGIGRPVAHEGPVVWYLSDIRRFGSVDVAPDFRRRSDVRSLECVERPGLVGRPLVWLGCGIAGRPMGLEASDVRSRWVVQWLELLLPLFFLFLVLGVLAFLYMVFLLVPGHA